MPKVRYIREKNNKGFVVLESAPQVRTVNHGVYVPLSFPRYSGEVAQKVERVRVPFPYLYHIVSYQIIPGRVTQYRYGGLFDNGLHVFLRQKPLESTQDMLYLSPSDMDRLGLVCTDHHHDGKTFKSRSQLVEFVVNSWWQLTHYLRNHYNQTLPSCEYWPALSLEDMMEIPLEPAGEFSRYVGHNTLADSRTPLVNLSLPEIDKIRR